MSDNDLLEAVVRDAHIAHYRKLIDFSTILAVSGAVDDADVARAVEADARVSLSMGVPVEAARYAEAVDFAACPLTERAAIDWHAQSLHEIDEVPLDEAKAIAAQAASTPGQKADVIGAVGRATGRRSRTRAAMTTVARVPWISIVAVILALGFLSSTGWSLYMTSREAEERANAKAQYSQGRADRTTELLEYEIMLREEAERITELKNLYSDEMVAAIDEILAEAITWIEGEEHLAEGYETFVGFEKVVTTAAPHDPELLKRFSRMRLNDLIMPSLRLVYGDEPALGNVYAVLAAVEAEWLEREMELINNEDE
jgi:hypothetical protein